MNEFWQQVFLEAFKAWCHSCPLDKAVTLAAMAANRAVVCCPPEEHRGVDASDQGQLEVAGWISVEDRLPEASGDVLVYLVYFQQLSANIIGGCVAMAHYSRAHASFNGCSVPDRMEAVMYWMPLPDSPEDAT